ncbi:hypothetical protein HanIR_Chr09g0390511 [Helianthus annuus]|nr:hypothetical protein HanIR_Chr09g0390511 [Helianthus annuus]
MKKTSFEGETKEKSSPSRRLRLPSFAKRTSRKTGAPGRKTTLIAVTYGRWP